LQIVFKLLRLALLKMDYRSLTIYEEIGTF